MTRSSAATRERTLVYEGVYRIISVGARNGLQGMDPVNKRFMWEVIARICVAQRECSIILTTHSMTSVGETLRSVQDA